MRRRSYRPIRRRNDSYSVCRGPYGGAGPTTHEGGVRQMLERNDI